MARRRHYRSQAKPTKQRALPHFDSLPDEILLAICKATGCEPPRDDRFKEATQVARAMVNSHAHEEDAVFVEKHPRELLPQSQPMAKVCRRVRAVFLDAHKDFKQPAHIYFLFPEKFTGFTCLEDVQHLEKITISPLMGLKLHVKGEFSYPWVGYTKRAKRAERLMESWTATRAWQPVVGVLSYLPDHVTTWIRWPDIMRYIDYLGGSVDMPKVVRAFREQPMESHFCRREGEGQVIKFSIEGLQWNYHNHPWAIVPWDRVSLVTHELNLRK